MLSLIHIFFAQSSAQKPSSAIPKSHLLCLKIMLLLNFSMAQILPARFFIDYTIFPCLALAQNQFFRWQSQKIPPIFLRTLRKTFLLHKTKNSRRQKARFAERSRPLGVTRSTYLKGQNWMPPWIKETFSKPAWLRINWPSKPRVLKMQKTTNSLSLGSSCAVSYTHLDVYKRQAKSAVSNSSTRQIEYFSSHNLSFMSLPPFPSFPLLL